MSKTYYPTIGLEIHAELKTDSKMFSGSPNNPDEERPNVNINPIDLGHPGTLPVINKKAIEHMVQIGLALDGEIANFTEFDRKNYFYPDIPKGYQISQYKYPIVSKGNLHGVDITRVHLEEDTGTSKHDKGDFSLVDYNRAGVPLMELVTEPVIKSAEQAVRFAKDLQLLLRYLGVGDANMEKGEMRVEANISISDDPNKFGTKVEVKNLNSFKAVERAIAFELERMEGLYEAGRQDEIVQETRGWDENKGITFSQRKKEGSADYRYFPEPDLPKLYLHDLFDLEKIRKELPELPWQKRERLIGDFDIKENFAEQFVTDIELGKYFEEVAEILKDKEKIALAANYIASDLVALLENGEKPAAQNFAKLIEMISENKLSSRGAKDILAILVKEDNDPEKIAEEKGLIQESDEGALETIVEKIISENPQAAEEYKAGKESSIQFLVGQGMKETQGSANPQILKKLFETKLQ